MSNRIVQYISGKELMERWGADLVKLWQINDNFLQAYDEHRRGRGPGYTPPGSPGRVWGYPSGMPMPSFPGGIKINKNVSLRPETPETAPQLLGYVFLIKDIECFEKDHPEIIPATNTPQQSQPPNGIVIDGTAPEYLLIAAAAWEALYKSGEHLKWKTGHTNKIISWIKKHHPHIKPTPAKMIAKIINPNKTGGAPRT